MAAQWPLVVARLLTVLPTLSGWGAVVSVHDGAARDSVRKVFCTVGHGTDGITSSAGAFTIAQAEDGFRDTESGTVVCQLAYSDDTPTLAPARAALFPLLDALVTYRRANRTLGVLSPEGTSEITFDVNSAQPIPGAAMAVLFTVTYFTVT